VRLDPELDELVKRAAAQEGSSVSEFLRLAAVERANRTLAAREQLDDVIGAVRTRGGSAARSGAAFAELFGSRSTET
jgi:hypothetical protein